MGRLFLFDGDWFQVGRHDHFNFAFLVVGLRGVFFFFIFLL